MSDAFDLVVIGSGPGGYVSAIRGAQLGLRTAVVEGNALGGRCLNYACIPAKAVLRAADVLDEVRHASQFGIHVGTPRVSFDEVRARRDEVVASLTGGVRGLLKKNGVEVKHGWARLAGDGAVTVDGETVHGRAIVLATGSVARPLPGLDFHGRVIGTEQAWALDALPDTIAVVGAGASGVELASAYARLGSKVRLIEASDRILPAEDADISAIVHAKLRRQGIAISTGVTVSDTEQSTDAVSFTVDGRTEQTTWLVVAAGRSPDTDSLALDTAGVELDDRGLIRVDERLRTTAPGIWAIGDLVRGPALAHKASEEGIIAAEDAAEHIPEPLLHNLIPRATFCSPSVASVGLTEEQARQQGYEVVVGTARYGAVGAGTVLGERDGLVKLVGDAKYGELLGAHIVGAKATELIQELVTARALEAGLPEIATIIHGHPTLSEAVSEAARDAQGWMIHG
ncbi:dihydrolipoyl dehydrogenanse (plasmid) [Rhodococcus jostii RHA1]|uniref:Dihydrolipoyl dehydrogenase n=1 Tax=Rhodococcus jostii (strain RHA1) TaxID=101510 RepID=Q0RVL5_RHOJR|nr:dihydrolipoyl dehydrogenase [Rhodococcus jostii]ABH00671.1 dihydrolipoyl dehydrogenanse [Rhodococcus jostii RHA1]